MTASMQQWIDDLPGASRSGDLRLTRAGAQFIPLLKRLWLIACFAAIVTGSLPACASLGGSVNSVKTDGARMNASINVSQQANYAVHAMQSPSGVTVKEFVSPDGNVFAVAWQGQFPPQLDQILGAYFNRYAAAISAQPRHYGHRPLNIQLPGLVIQTGGHMRDYFGRAYIPEMLPTGVKADQIR